MEKVFVIFDVTDQTLSLRIPSVTIRAGTKGLYWAKIFFDAAWQNLQNIKAGFFRNDGFHPVSLTAEADGSYICEIPPPVIANAGQFSIGMFAGCQLITNTEFVPVLPSFKNDVFNNADFLNWFEETDKLLAEILEKAQMKENMTDVLNEDSTAEQYPNVKAVISYVQEKNTALKDATDNLLMGYATTKDKELIQEQISTLTTHINAMLDSDDITLDQLSEIVAYIKSNKTLIDAITTSKANTNHLHDDRYLKKTLVLTGSINSAESRMTLTSSYTANDVADAYSDQREIVLSLSFEDEGLTNICIHVPLRSVNANYYFFSAPIAIDASENMYLINCPVGRSSLAHYGITFKKITT